METFEQMNYGLNIALAIINRQVNYLEEGITFARTQLEKAENNKAFWEQHANESMTAIYYLDRVKEEISRSIVL